VLQDPFLFSGTVADNIRFAAELAGRSPDIGEVLTHAGLDPSFADRDAARLSVGEQQRVMLARALALEPEVLLLDEPTASLDADATDAVEQALQGLRDVSYVLVTHNAEQAERLSDRMVRLEAGRVKR